MTHIQNGHQARQQGLVESDVESTGQIGSGQSSFGPPISPCPNVESHIENLYAAIHDEDVSRLKQVVDDLNQDSAGVEVLNDATQRLDDAMTSENGIEEVLLLAKEVMDVCRANRSITVQNEEINSKK